MKQFSSSIDVAGKKIDCGHNFLIANTIPGYMEQPRQSSVHRAMSFFKPKRTSKHARTKSEGTIHYLSSMTTRSLSISQRISRYVHSNNPVSDVAFHEKPWNEWLELYCSGTVDLSVVGPPQTYGDNGYFPAPDCPYEKERLEHCSEFFNPELWARSKHWLEEHLLPMKKKFKLSAVTASTIEETSQHIHYHIGLDDIYRVISRKLSLDAHTILSEKYFCVLNAHNDWRTRLNPLVHGPPYISFYCGVPIFTRSGYPMGVLAVYDQFARTIVPVDLIKQLLKLSAQITLQIDPEVTVPRPRIDWASEKGHDEMSPESKVSSEFDQPDISCTVGSVELSLLRKSSPLNSNDIFRELEKSKTVREAAVKSCLILCQALNMPFVKIVEVRLKSCYTIPYSQLCFPSGTLVKEIPEFESLDLEKVFRNNLGVRTVAKCGDAAKEIPVDLRLFSVAAEATNGIRFSSTSPPPREGLMIPFRKTHATVVYATSSPLQFSPAFSGNGQTDSNTIVDAVSMDQQMSELFSANAELFDSNVHLKVNEVIENNKNSWVLEPVRTRIYIRSGGYLACGYVEGERSFSLSDKAFIHRVCGVIEAIIENQTQPTQWA